MNLHVKISAVAFAVACSVLVLSHAHAATPLVLSSPDAKAPKATLKKAELNQTAFTAPGKITNAAWLTSDIVNPTKCQFSANIFRTAEGDNAINTAVVSGIKLAASLPGLVGPITADLTPGKYRIDFFVDNEPSSACKGSATATFEVQRQKMGVPPGKILSLGIQNSTDVTKAMELLTVKVIGEGRTCNYEVQIVSPGNKNTVGRPSVIGSSGGGSTESIITIPFYSDGGKHGQYKLTAMAMPNDTRPGASCLGTASANFNFIRDNKVTLATDTPMIQDILLEPGTKIGGYAYYSNELLKFKVGGSIDNAGPDVTNRCGWTAQLETKDGSSVVRVIGSYSQFGVWQTSLPLIGLEAAEYRLTVKTTPADDALAKQPCLGKISKQVNIFAPPGKITGVDLRSFGVMGTFSNAGHLFATPKITGPTCVYKITRKLNYTVGSDVVTYHTHQASGGDEMSLGEYGDAQTIVEVIVEGYEKAGILGCEGKASRTIQVFDEIHKQGLVLN